MLRIKYLPNKVKANRITGRFMTVLVMKYTVQYYYGKSSLNCFAVHANTIISLRDNLARLTIKHLTMTNHQI